MSGSWIGWRVDGETYCFDHADAVVLEGYTPTAARVRCVREDGEHDPADGWAQIDYDGEPLCFGHAKDLAVDDGWLVPLLDSDGYAEEDRRCRSCDLLLS